MGKCNLSSGGVRSNLRAAVEIPADRVFKYSSTVNEVELCGSGEEADGLCLAEVLTGEILNASGGQCHSRKDTGVFDNVTVSGEITVGGEWMSGASGVVTAYVAAGDNRPLGKFVADRGDGTAKVTFYSK